MKRPEAMLQYRAAHSSLDMFNRTETVSLEITESTCRYKVKCSIYATEHELLNTNASWRGLVTHSDSNLAIGVKVDWVICE